MVLKSINLLKNMRPAGRILNENESFPIKDSSSRFVYLLWVHNDDNSCSSDCFLSEVMLASTVMVLRCVPRKMSEVVGPSTFDGLTGTSNILYSVSIALRLCLHVSELAGPAVKKSSR